MLLFIRRSRHFIYLRKTDKMYKILLTMIGILAAVYLVLTLADVNSEYMIEKRFWQIEARYKDVVRDQGFLPKGTSAQMVDELEEFIAHYPQSSLVAKARLNLAMIYVLEENHASAKLILEDIIRQYPQQPELGVAAARQLIAIYEQEKNIPQVVLTYQEVLKRFPLTEFGLRIPLLLAQFYIEQGEMPQAKAAYEQAIEYYWQIIKEDQQSEISFKALNLLATAYVMQAQWADAVDVFGQILLNYTDTKQLDSKKIDQVIKSINIISVNKLEDYAQAIHIYEGFLEKYPDHELSTKIQGVVRGFKKLNSPAAVIGEKI